MRIQHDKDFNPFAYLSDVECVMHIIRTPTWNRNTWGELLINAVKFCDTCEDEIRDEVVKVDSHTCIPAFDNYIVDVTYSPRFKKLLPIIYTEKDKVTIKVGDVKFAGVRFHGGVDHTHSDGCPLVGYGVSNEKLLRGPDASRDICKRLMEIKGYAPVWDAKQKWWVKGADTTEGKPIRLVVVNPLK